MEGMDEMDEIPDSDDGEREQEFARTQPREYWRLHRAQRAVTREVPKTIEPRIIDVSFILFIIHVPREIDRETIILTVDCQLQPIRGRDITLERCRNSDQS